MAGTFTQAAKDRRALFRESWKSPEAGAEGHVSAEAETKANRRFGILSYKMRLL